jgi:hypothetical protein
MDKPFDDRWALKLLLVLFTLLLIAAVALLKMVPRCVQTRPSPTLMPSGAGAANA